MMKNARCPLSTDGYTPHSRLCQAVSQLLDQANKCKPLPSSAPSFHSCNCRAHQPGAPAPSLPLQPHFESVIYGSICLVITPYVGYFTAVPPLLTGSAVIYRALSVSLLGTLKSSADNVLCVAKWSCRCEEPKLIKIYPNIRNHPPPPVWDTACLALHAVCVHLPGRGWRLAKQILSIRPACHKMNFAVAAEHFAHVMQMQGTHTQFLRVPTHMYITR